MARTKIRRTKFGGYRVAIKKVKPNTYDWSIKGKSGFTGKETTFAEGIAFVENKKQVENITKEYIKENLSRI